MVCIRVANASDIAGLVLLVNTTFAIEAFLEGARTSAEHLAQTTETGDLLIAEDESGSVVACVSVSAKEPEGYFGMLAVDPRCQGAGLGCVMVQAAEDYLRNRACPEVRIDVLSLRTDLPPFYRRLGYVEAGTRPAPLVRRLKPGFECHSIVMSKML
jgi:ribosomal protein S18 acetylase RimI-like enzyme